MDSFLGSDPTNESKQRNGIVKVPIVEVLLLDELLGSQMVGCCFVKSFNSFLDWNTIRVSKWLWLLSQKMALGR